MNSQFSLSSRRSPIELQRSNNLRAIALQQPPGHGAPHADLHLPIRQLPTSGRHFDPHTASVIHNLPLTCAFSQSPRHNGCNQSGLTRPSAIRRSCTRTPAPGLLQVRRCETHRTRRPLIAPQTPWHLRRRQPVHAPAPATGRHHSPDRSTRRASSRCRSHTASFTVPTMLISPRTASCPALPTASGLAGPLQLFGAPTLLPLGSETLELARTSLCIDVSSPPVFVLVVSARLALGPSCVWPGNGEPTYRHRSSRRTGQRGAAGRAAGFDLCHVGNTRSRDQCAGCRAG